MEEKKITPQESMALIGEMIATTRRRLSFKESNFLFLWGTMTTLISALVGILIALEPTPLWNFLWVLLFPAGIYHFCMSRRYKVKEPVTYIDKLSSRLWMGVLGLCILCVLICSLFYICFHQIAVWYTIFFFPFVIVGMAAFVQGLIIRENSLAFGGVFGITMTGLLYCYLSVKGVLGSTMSNIPEDELLNLILILYITLSITYFVMFMIPGIILRCKAKKQAQ